MLTTTIRKVFPSVPFAHRQPHHDGHCKLIHGHNWTIEVVLGAHSMDENGFVLDFGKMKPLKEEVAKVDHAIVLNFDDPEIAHFENYEFAKLKIVRDCSCEGLAHHFFDAFNARLDADTQGRVFVVELTVHEDEKNSATVKV